MIDFGLDEDEREIVSALSTFLADQAPLDRLNPAPEPALNRDRALVPKLAELGYLSLGLPEAHGGIGLPLAVEALVFREYGRHLLSPAILGSVIGARIAAEQGDPRTSAGIATGEISVGLASPVLPRAGGPGAGDDVHLLEADAADLVVAWGEFGAALIPLTAFDDLQTAVGLDSTLHLSRARLAANVERWGDDISIRADVLCAAALCGIAEMARDSSVDYVKTREQFGQPIGAFQSVKHRCANMAVRATAAWAQTLYAALEAEELGHVSAFQGHCAVLIAADAGVQNGAANIQNHGGIGFTGEHHPHLLLKRAHVLDQLCGGSRLRQRRLLRMPAPAA